MGSETHKPKKKEKGEDLFCFGANNRGQLGIGSKKDQKKPVFLMKREEVKEIACGCQHTLILKRNGDLLVCGNNNNDQLGIEGIEKTLKPVLLMSDNTIKQICCGDLHSMLLHESGEVWVWGGNQHGNFFSKVFQLLIWN